MQEHTKTRVLSVAQRIRVPAGFALAVVVVLEADPTWGSLCLGGGIAMVGLMIRAWAAGYLRKNEQLTTTGPYAYTRNPLYLGSFVLGAGVALSAGAVWLVAVFALLYLLVYVPVMIAEANTMRVLFPNDYGRYSQHVPLFAPRLTAYHADAAQATTARFDRALYLRHREYRAALGTAAVLALLAAKLYFRL